MQTTRPTFRTTALTFTVWDWSYVSRESDTRTTTSVAGQDPRAIDDLLVSTGLSSEWITPIWFAAELVAVDQRPVARARVRTAPSPMNRNSWDRWRLLSVSPISRKTPVLAQRFAVMPGAGKGGQCLEVMATCGAAVVSFAVGTHILCRLFDPSIGGALEVIHITGSTPSSFMVVVARAQTFRARFSIPLSTLHSPPMDRPATPTDEGVPEPAHELLVRKRGWSAREGQRSVPRDASLLT